MFANKTSLVNILVEFLIGLPILQPSLNMHYCITHLSKFYMQG